MCSINVHLLKETQHQKGLYVVRDELELLDDSGEVHKLNGVASGLIPKCEIVSLLDRY